MTTSSSAAAIERTAGAIARTSVKGVDAALIVASLLFGAPSLAYPFGPHQGLFYYMGREWFLRGALPYRDMVEHKSPGIFVIHGSLVSVFGEHPWPIRLLDLAFVLGIGAFAASLLEDGARGGGRRTPGLLGVCCLTASVLYFGVFSFGETAQCELPMLFFAMASLVAARRIAGVASAAIVAGLCGGAAVIVKAPVFWVLLLALAAVSARAKGAGGWGRAAVAAGLFLAGAAIVPLLEIGYYAAHRALPDMVTCILKMSGHYADDAEKVHGFVQVLARTGGVVALFAPVSAVLLPLFALAAVAARRRGDRAASSRYAWALALFLASWAAVYTQHKFYRYHSVVFVGAFALLAGALLLDGVERFAPRLRARAPLLFAAGVVAAFCGSPALAGGWLSGASRALRLWSGGIDRAQYAAELDAADGRSSLADAERAAIWVRDHSTADDSVAVRGFEPQIYAESGRRYRGRFFSTEVITDPRRSQQGERWLDEERRAVESDPPALVVTPSASGEIVGADWHASFGYVERARFGSLRVLARDHATSRR